MPHQPPWQRPASRAPFASYVSPGSWSRNHHPAIVLSSSGHGVGSGRGRRSISPGLVSSAGSGAVAGAVQPGRPTRALNQTGFQAALSSRLVSSVVMRLGKNGEGFDVGWDLSTTC